MSDNVGGLTLDPAQQSAVGHGDAPLVVVAGAGTGKTQTLTARVAHLVGRGVAPERILLLTFTRRAAAAMTARAAVLCGDRSAARRLWAGTFHAVAHRLVTEHAEVLGLPRVTLLDPPDVVDLLDMIRDEHGLGTGRVRLPTARSLADMCTRVVNTQRPARAVIEADFPQYLDSADVVVPVLADFMRRKREAGLLDFDDLLLAWRALLSNPTVAERLRGRWAHVLVDEYQDVNQMQVDIVRALRPDGHGLTVVGDDAQAVYGFRGASGAHLAALADAFPDSRVVRLQTNFRSPQALLDLANVVRPATDASQSITLTAARDDPDAPRPQLFVCHDAAEQARVVTDAVLADRETGLELRDMAVLMRAGQHSRELELELTARNVPFVKYGGLRFVETAHVKDFLAALRLTANAGDAVSWFRLLKLHRHVGKAHARTLSTRLADDGIDARNEVIGAAPEKSRRAIGTTLTAFADARDTPPTARVQRCLDIVRPLVNVHYDDAALRLDDLDRLAGAAAASDDVTAFLADLTLDPAGATTDYAKPAHVDDDYLTLSTVHSAKGLEWEAVHVIHAVDGAFPSDMALHDDDGLDEERRLFYVAVTRARQTLSIYHPHRLHPNRVGDRHVYTQASRFLDDAALATVDTVHLSGPSVAAGTTLPPAARVDIPTLDDLFA